VNRNTTPLGQVRQIKRLNGAGGESEGSLPKGPSRAERELLEAYDLMEAKVRRLPSGVQWQQVAIERTPEGLRCRVTV
jgi:hypothetical protein